MQSESQSVPDHTTDPTVYSIALDVESVLADILGYFVTQYNHIHGTDYNKSDIDNWDWVRSEVDFDEFNRIVDMGWMNAEIQPEEKALAESTAKIVERDNTVVDVVTARTGVEDEMKRWLSNLGISYNQFYSVEQTKATIGYDAYIDDSVPLGGKLDTDQTQYLVVGPHNHAAKTHEQTVPVNSVAHAVHTLQAEKGEYLGGNPQSSSHETSF